MTTQVIHHEDIENYFKAILETTTPTGTMAERVVKLARISPVTEGESSAKQACISLPIIFDSPILEDVECIGRMPLGSECYFAFEDGTFAKQWFAEWSSVTPLNIVDSAQENREKAQRFISDPIGWDMPDDVREVIIGPRPEVSEAVREALQYIKNADLEKQSACIDMPISLFN